MKKDFSLTVLVLFLLFAGCDRPAGIDGVYRYYAGERNGYHIWIVDGSVVRRRIYPEFLYGGNEQRYPFNPRGEVWIDHAVSCEEFELTLAHELNERHLMAKFGWTYERAHDSSLAIEVVMRRRFDSVCRNHEAFLPKVSPTDYSNTREIRTLPDSIRLNQIYRVPLGMQDGVSVWIVDGYLVRKTIFPDFGFSGNDLSCHFIPRGEIWIDGQISAEETGYSIAEELIIRKLMKAGRSFSDAYLEAIADNGRQRERMEARIKQHPPVSLPDSLTRYAGTVDPMEK